MREMKDSKIAWLGEIPAHWKSVPIGALFHEIRTKNVFGNEKQALQFKMGAIVPKTNFDAKVEDYVANTITSYTLVDCGTIIINGLNLNFDFVTQRVALVKDRGAITSAYMAIKANDLNQMMPKYSTYLLKTYDNCKAFHNMGGGVRKILNFDELRHNYIIVPPLDEQKKIVEYLDAKASEIDALKSEIQSQIDTLEQYKRSVITEAVTKGLNPNVEMKDSGIEWIGEIPAHWNVKKVKYLTSQRNENSTYNPETDIYIGLENIKAYSDELLETDTMYEKSVQSVFKAGDVLFNKLRPYLSKVMIAKFDGFSTGELLNFNAFQGNNKFLFYTLLNTSFIDVVNASTYGAKMPRANTDFIINLPVCVVPIEEQNIIVDYLDAKCSEIDDCINAKKEQLATLESYKKSLIYEYVTGKKEVPHD